MVTPTTTVTVNGRNILINGEVFHMKGVNWNPIPIGVSVKNKTKAYFSENIEVDGELLEELGTNLIRTYEPILNISVLDALYRRNIYLMQPIYVSAEYGITPETSDIQNIITTTKSHPAIMGWYVGNEWNYNNLYVYEELTFDEVVTYLNTAASMANQYDGTHPVISIYGELPTADLIARMPEIDIWGTNVYRSDTFDDIFQVWEARSTKPLFLGEYGADAYNANINSVDEASQAYATKTLTDLIVAESTVTGGVLSGGIIFEFNDEWWKAPGNVFHHDVGGIAPGGGPYPDITFNEEWWGLVDIYRNKRQAFTAFKDVALPVAAPLDDGCSGSPVSPVGVVFLAMFTFLLGMASHYVYNRAQTYRKSENSKKEEPETKGTLSPMFRYA